MTDALDLLRSMMLIRAFETALAKRPDHGFQLLSTGEEAVAVGLSAALSADDQLLTGGRAIGPALARGVDPARLMAELLGRVDGINRGRAGRGHLSDPEHGFFGAHAVVGGNISIATGVALSRQMTGEPGIVAILFGDGACGAGSLHEAFNIAALWKLPILFVCNNNQLSVSTPRDAALAPHEISDLGKAYGIESKSVDGLDLEAVVTACRRAATTVRSGQGPVFLEFSTVRLASHSTTARETRSRAELAVLWNRCPIQTYQRILRDQGALDETGLASITSDVDATVIRAADFAEASPHPEPAEATLGVW